MSISIFATIDTTMAEVIVTRLVRCIRHSFPKLVARTKRADVGFHSSQYPHLSQNSIVTPCALVWVNSEVENGTAAVVSQGSSLGYSSLRKRHGTAVRKLEGWKVGRIALIMFD
jgi:hypothetical protein